MILFEHHYIVSSVYICSVSARTALGLSKEYFRMYTLGVYGAGRRPVLYHHELSLKQF